jgi:hypothetical protein
MGWEPSKDHNMSGSNSSAGQNGYNALNNHRHVDDNPVPCDHFELVFESSSHIFHSSMKFRVCNGRPLDIEIATAPVMGLSTK